MDRLTRHRFTQRARNSQLGFQTTFVGDTSQMGAARRQLGMPWFDIPGSNTVPQNQQGGNFQHYWDTVIGTISQVISAYSGPNSGNQVSYTGQVIPVPQAQVNASTPQVVVAPGANPYDRAAAARDTSIGAGADSLVTLITDNPGTTALIVFGVYLLFRPSPSAKNR